MWLLRKDLIIWVYLSVWTSQVLEKFVLLRPFSGSIYAFESINRLAINNDPFMIKAIICNKGRWLSNKWFINSCASKTSHFWKQCQHKTTKCTLQIYKLAILSGEEFMVLENLIGEKFMIPCKNIHPCQYGINVLANIETHLFCYNIGIWMFHYWPLHLKFKSFF